MQSQPEHPQPLQGTDHYALKHKLIELRDALREAHAQLEFLRLMLRMNRPLP
jgi:hypothetical protein